MILENLEANFGVGKSADNIQEPFSRYRPGAILLNVGRTPTTHTELKVRGADPQTRPRNFKEEVGKNRDGSFSLDHPLREV